VSYFQANPALTLGQASAYFADSEYRDVIDEALGEPLLHQAEGSELDLEAEIRDLVDKLGSDHQARRRSELARLLDAGTATPEQRAEYNELHARLAMAKSGNPPPEARSKL
jgi:Spy/CpxP family protein refolding chaperone